MNKTEAKKLFVKATDLVPLRTPKNDPDYGRPRIGAGSSKAVPLSVQAARLRQFTDLDPETMARLGYLQGASDSPDAAGKVANGAGYAAMLTLAVAGMMSAGGKRSERRPIEVRNIRVTNVPDAIATLSHRKISGASSILTSPNATFSTISTGYGYSSVPGSVHLMFTPTATTPDRNTGVVTFLGDGYTASSKAFYKKVGDYEHGLSLSKEEPSLGLFTKAYYDKELMKRGVPTRDNGKMFFSKVPDYENIPTNVKTAAFKDARNAWLRDYAEKKGAQAPGLVPTRFGYPVGRPDLMEKDIQWFRNAGHLVLDSASAVSDPSARDRLSYMLGHPYSTSYVENKMYMPLDIPEAIGGIAMSHDVPTRLADIIRGRAQYFGIPVRTFDKRPPQSRSFPELEPVIKDMAPVTSLDAKGGRVTKGGDAPDLTGMSNFLATDKVPDTLFGIPVVTRREDYTEADLRFFKDHPEAGGYYDMGDETPEDGSAEGAPVQADKGGAARSAYPGSWNNPGNVRPGSVEYVGQNGTKKSTKSDGTFLTFDTPQNGLNAMADVVRQIASVKIPMQFNEERLADDRFTIRTLLEVYAPETDKNDVNDYAKFVSKRLGVGPSDELRLDDTATMAKLLDAMVRKDSGHEHANWFTPEEYRTAAKRMKGTRK